MFKKIKNSFAFRSAVLYKLLLKFVPLKRKAFRTTDSVTIITLTGKKHIDMLRESINSMLIKWDAIPQIIIYTDGSITVDELKTYFQHVNVPIEFKDWTDALYILKEQPVYKELESFARSNVIGRKLVVILSNCINKLTLWWDSDILWFKPLGDLAQVISQDQFFIKTSKDYQIAYTENISRMFPELASKPFINSGLVLIKGNFLTDFNFQKIISIASKESNHFSEQTAIAYLVHNFGLNTWDLDFISCSQDDQLSLGPTYINKNWTARHYVGPVRHLFWRDAFFLRIKT